MADFALMCPQCSAIVAGGDEEGEQFAMYENLARTAGLTFLRMLAPPLGSEHCDCPAPSPLSKFVVLLKMSGVVVEHKDPKSGKWRKGFGEPTPETDIPDLQGKKLSKDAADAALEEFKAKTGLDGIVSLNLYTQGIPGTKPKGTLADEKIQTAFKVDNHDALFLVMVRREGRKRKLRIVESTLGFQLWPQDHLSCLTTEDKKLKRLQTDVVFPFVAAMARVTPEKYAKWLEGCIEINREKVEA